MGLVYKNRRNAGYFNSYILQRVERNKNFIACITGQTGSGKSWTALKMGEALDPEFNILNVCFSPKEFMNLINGVTKKLKKGSVIVYDEVQVSMSHLEYQSIQAKMLNYVLQTFRHKNFILLMTSPHFYFINASVRKLFHSRMETMKIDQDNKQVILKPFLLQVNQHKGDVYRKYLRVSTERGVAPLKTIRVGKPSDELIKAYEDKKTAFTTDLNKNIAKDLERLEEKKKDKIRLTVKQEELLEELRSGKLLPEIAEQSGVSTTSLYVRLESIRKKGIDVKAIKDSNTNKVLRYEVGEI